MRTVHSIPNRDFFNRVYKRSPRIVARRIEDENLLVPIEAGVGETDAIYTLNAVGADIWQRLDGKKNLKQIVDILLKRYAVDRREIEHDLKKFIRTLEAMKAIRCR